MGKLDGRIALITGGDHGIGFLTAKEFVKEGAYVFITGSSHSRLAAAVKQIEAEELRGTRVGRNVLGVQGVVSNAGELDHVFAQIEREKGELDVVFAATNEKISDNLTERENHSSFDKLSVIKIKSAPHRWSVPSAHAPSEWLFGRIGPRWIAIDSSM